MEPAILAANILPAHSRPCDGRLYSKVPGKRRPQPAYLARGIWPAGPRSPAAAWLRAGPSRAGVGDASESGAVAVVGGGICGFFLALLLAQAGRRVCIFERGTAKPRGKFGFLLNSRGIAALRAYDEEFVDRLARIGNATTKMSIVVGGQKVSETAVSGITVLRSRLVEELQDEAAKYRDRISVHYGHKLLHLDTADKCLTFQREGSDGTVSVDADRVVACDGNYSLIRREIQRLAADGHWDFSPSETPWGFGIRCITICRDLTGFDPGAHYIYGDIGYVCRVAERQWVLALSVDDGEAEESFLNATQPTPENVSSLHNLIQSATTAVGLPALTLTNAELESFFRARKISGALVDVPALSMGEWLALAGDAAHAVSPFAGEGANSSLEDATILANALQTAGRHAFREFDRKRRKDVQALHRIALYRNSGVAGSDEQKIDYFVDSVLVSACRRLGLFKKTQQSLMQTDSNKVSRYEYLEKLHRKQLGKLAPVSSLVKFLVRTAAGVMRPSQTATQKNLIIQ